MVTRSQQRLGGLLLAVAGAGLTAWIWYTALTEHSFPVKASLLFPAILVLGVGATILPGYKEERIARGEDISNVTGWRLITPRWWTVIAIALLASSVNYYLLSSL